MKEKYETNKEESKEKVKKDTRNGRKEQEQRKGKEEMTVKKTVTIKEERSTGCARSISFKERNTS